MLPLSSFKPELYADKYAKIVRRKNHWWRLTGSNRRPPACKAGALPAELIPRYPLLESIVVGLVGLEPTTPALSRRCSNQLSYRPIPQALLTARPRLVPTTDKCGRSNLIAQFSRKEVIQPHLPIRLPCYDFTPIIYPTFGGWLHKGYLTDFGCYKLSWCDGRCVQGPGTYSPWHADPRLLAIPASCRRVAAYNPN